MLNEMKRLSVWFISSNECTYLELLLFGIIIALAQTDFLFVLLCFPMGFISGGVKRYFAEKEGKA